MITSDHDSQSDEEEAFSDVSCDSIGEEKCKEADEDKVEKMKERSPAEISFGISQTTNQHDYFHRRTKEIQDLTTIKQKMGSGTKPKVLTTSSLSWAKQTRRLFCYKNIPP